MRIYSNPFETVREVERDLFEMGTHVPSASMQDKIVAGNPDYDTKELQGYCFKLSGYKHDVADEAVCVNYILTGDRNAGPHANFQDIMGYIELEHKDRVGGVAMNPGNAWKARQGVWNEFMHNGKFAYTYSERMTPQLERIIRELKEKPNTRQAIINLHSNICPQTYDFHGTNPPGEPTKPAERMNMVLESADLLGMGGASRIPCSMYYQLMIREGKLDLIYTMRSCDFLTHFYVDFFLALRLQKYVAERLGIETGMFTYFAGSFHAYARDLRTRGIF